MNKSIESVGVIKEIDSLGRIVIPKEFRDRLMLDKKVELVLTDNGVLIRNSEYTLVKASERKNGSF
jgi:AbrB family looped-hinge helix DNA binding protein